MAVAAIRKRLWRTVMDLPSPLLRAASGGRAVHVAGRTLDPRFQLLLHLASHGGEASGEGADDSAAFASAVTPAGVRQAPVSIDGPRGTIEAFMFTPDGATDSAPLMVYAHRHEGGAPGLLAAGSGLRVLAVAYRLGAEHRLPAGLSDLMAAYAWARESAARAGAPARPAVGGESLGGGMAAAACLELRRLGQPQPALQCLIYPILDAAETPAAGEPFADAALLSPTLEAWRAGRVLGPADDPLDPSLSPARAKELSGLAPAVIAAAGYDPLQTQASAYARALKAAGVAVTLRAFDALPHGFLDYGGVIAPAREAGEVIAALAGAAVRGEPGRPEVDSGGRFP